MSPRMQLCCSQAHDASRLSVTHGITVLWLVVSWSSSGRYIAPLPAAAAQHVLYAANAKRNVKLSPKSLVLKSSIMMTRNAWNWRPVFYAVADLLVSKRYTGHCHISYDRYRVVQAEGPTAAKRTHRKAYSRTSSSTWCGTYLQKNTMYRI